MTESHDGSAIQPRGSLEFVESSILDTFVPASSDFSIEDALRRSTENLNESSSSPLSTIAQRQSLLFDESLTVYITLQTPYFDERALRSYLSRLVISLDAKVVNATSEDYNGPPNHEAIFSGSVDPIQDPLIIVHGPVDDEEGRKIEGHVLILWKQCVVLTRPFRLRMQSPSVVFSATANLKPAEPLLQQARKDEYLPSTVPSGINLLESFSNDPELGPIRPRLSALRVSRVVPTTQVSTELLRPVKNISRKSLKVYPAFHARVRYARPTTIPTNSAITASLDVDITPFAGHAIQIQDVQLTVNDAIVEDMNSAQGLLLPISCLPRDDLTFLYRIRSPPQDNATGNVKPVQITVTAKVIISEVCSPLLILKWQTSVDFTPPVNSSFGAASLPIHRSHRPAQLSIDSSALTTTTTPTISSLAINQNGNVANSSTVTSTPHPDSLPVVEPPTRQIRNGSFPDFGVTLSFTAPPSSQRIRVGEEFIWHVFIVNRSDRARKLALVVIPRRKRLTSQNHNRIPSTSYRNQDKHKSKDGKIIEVADAVIDENILRSLQRAASVDSAELICLSSDVRIGPLAPNACHDVDIRFLAMKAGVLGEGMIIRVLDLGGARGEDEHVDIEGAALPAIVVH